MCWLISELFLRKKSWAVAAAWLQAGLYELTLYCLVGIGYI